MDRILVISLAVLTSLPLPGKSQENRKQSQNLFFQPSIHYQGEGEPSHSGTGFFITGPGDRIFALTSAHFFNFRKEIEKVEWLNLPDKQPVASFGGTFGPPGQEGQSSPAMDLRTDFMVFRFDGENEPDCLALSLDGRPVIQKNEALWFPYRDPEAQNGWRMVSAKTYAVEEGVIGVFLGEKVDLQARSGSPLLTKGSNRVVGLLYGAVDLKSGEELTLFAPVQKLVEQMKSQSEIIAFEDYELISPAQGGNDAGELAGSKWEGVTPFGNPVTVTFNDTQMSWDSLKDWTDEIEWTEEPNKLSTNWPKLNNTEVTFTFSEEMDSCVVVIGVAPKPMTLNRVD